MNPDAAFNRLLLAWEVWDARPSNDAAAAAMVEACRDYAGVCVEFRRHLQTVSRAGLNRTQAILSWDSQW
jgi:hypothetical protein